MNVVIFVVLAFTLGCLTVLALRPIVRTALLSGFMGLVFTGFDAPPFALALTLLGIALREVEQRVTKSIDGLGDRLEQYLVDRTSPRTARTRKPGA